jgi:hypothetical protein
MGTPARDEAGNIWEIDEQGNPIRLIQAASAPSPSTIVPPNPARVARDQREADRQTAADARAAAAAERAAAAADRAEREWNATHNPDGSPKNKSGNKPMRQGDATKLEEEITAYSYLKDSLGAFQDDFAGNAVTGGLENTLQRKFGTGTPGQADWWANFKSVDNLIRNALFGASLTSGEKAAYAETTIDPSMRPEIVRKNLERRAEIARKALERKVSRLHNTYNPEEVEAALGEFRDEMLPRKEETDKTSQIQPNAPSADQLAVATGATSTEHVRGPVEKKLSAMLASGASSANIRAYAKANNFPSGRVESVLAWRAMHPQYKGGYDVSTEVIKPTTGLNRVLASPLGTIATQAANAATAGTLDEIGGAARSLVTGEPLDETIASANFNKRMQAELNPKSALAGNVLGGAAAMLTGGAALRTLLPSAAPRLSGWIATNPIKSAALGDATYGAAYGAGESNDNRLAGAAIGAPAAGIGSIAGSGAVRAVGSGVRGVVNPAAERLRAMGIPLTGAEVLGGGWKKAQDALTSLPVVGSMVARRNQEGRRGLNEAAFNAAGDIVGEQINAVGQEGVDLLNQAKNRAYAEALDPVRLNLDEPGFIGDIRALGEQIGRIPNDDGVREAAMNAIQYRIGNSVDDTGGMAGRNFQEAYRGLGRAPRERGAQRPYAYEFGQAMRSGQDALANVLERQEPGAYQGFLRANSANRHLNVLADAVNAAKSQVADGEVLFTPAQLGTAATNNAKTYGGKLAAALGDRPFNELVRDATQVMGQTVADSGTATRAAVGLGLTSLGTGGAGYGSGGEEGATVGAIAPAAVLTLLGTRRGQQALTAALLNRPTALRGLGNTLRNRAVVGGDILAAGAVPYYLPR